MTHCSILTTCRLALAIVTGVLLLPLLLPLLLLLVDGALADGAPEPMRLPIVRYNADHTDLIGTDIELRPERTALVLVDVWAADGRRPDWDRQTAAVTRQQIAPLVALAREHRVLVVHAHHGRDPDSLVSPQDEDLVSDGRVDRLFPTLQARGIDTLLYAGYSAELCLMLRPVGMTVANALGFRVVMIEDATAAWGGPQALRVAIDQAQHGWCTTQTRNVMEAGPWE